MRGAPQGRKLVSASTKRDNETVSARQRDRQPARRTFGSTGEPRRDRRRHRQEPRAARSGTEARARISARSEEGRQRPSHRDVALGGLALRAIRTLGLSNRLIARKASAAAATSAPLADDGRGASSAAPQLRARHRRRRMPRTLRRVDAVCEAQECAQRSAGRARAAMEPVPVLGEVYAAAGVHPRIKHVDLDHCAADHAARGLLDRAVERRTAARSDDESVGAERRYHARPSAKHKLDVDGDTFDALLEKPPHIGAQRAPAVRVRRSGSPLRAASPASARDSRRPTRPPR